MDTVEFIDIAAEVREDSRGTSLCPWQGRIHDPQDFLATFHLVSIQPGQTRGNHLHPRHLEWLYPFHGAGAFLWQTPGEKVQEKLLFGHSTIIRIPPGVAHAVRNVGPEMLYLLAWQERGGQGPGEPETVRHPLGGD
jgi:quercetin dioxygenase-like cupin family protein